jgi:hypothetical protein
MILDTNYSHLQCSLSCDNVTCRQHTSSTVNVVLTQDSSPTSLLCFAQVDLKKKFFSHTFRAQVPDLDQYFKRFYKYRRFIQSKAKHILIATRNNKSSYVDNNLFLMYGCYLSVLQKWGPQSSYNWPPL